MIYLVWHGQTDFNKTKKFNGLTDTELTPLGIEQSKLQGENLKGVYFDKVFSSTSKRARQTCEIIYKGEITFDDRLTEINCGEFEGTEETPEAMQQFWHAIRNGSRGTETFQCFIDRNCDFCDMLAKHHAGENILVVTHSANARIFNYYFSGKSKDYDFKKSVIKNGGLLTFELSKNLHVVKNLALEIH